MIGTELEGKYRIDAELGSGGVGTVYRGVHLERGLAVAVKVLRPELASSAELRHRFEREGRALTSLSHPNIVAVVDSGVSGDIAYLVMELLEGETLADRLKKGALVPAEAFAVLRQLLLALAFVHEQGLVHRDVKPGNIFLSPGPGGIVHVRLLDFGLAKFLAPEAASKVLTRAGQVFGTPAYMAPEQIAGQEADPRADVYAVGIVLFEMLAGKAPFLGDASEVLRLHVMEDIPVDRGLPVGIASEIKDLIRRAAAKTRAERFANAKEMLEALDRAVPVASPDPGYAETALDVGAPSEPYAQVPGPERDRRSVGRWLVAAGSVLALLVSMTAASATALVIYVYLHPEAAKRPGLFETAYRLVSSQTPLPLPAASVRPGSPRPATSSSPKVVVPTPGSASPPVLLPGTDSPTAPRVAGPAPDPWVGAPSEILRLASHANRSRGFDKHEILALHQYNAKHPNDPRGHLVLAHGYLGRRWFKDVVNEYAIALKTSDTARGDPRMLHDLLTLVEFGSGEAARLIREVFGEAADPAVLHLLSGPLPNPEAKVFLERLRAELANPPEPARLP